MVDDRSAKENLVDGGRYITLPLVISRDPATGKRNVGTYRMQVYDSHTAGMHWQSHKVGASHYRSGELQKLLQQKGETEVQLIIRQKDTKFTIKLENPRKFDLKLFNEVKNREYVKKITF